MQIKGLEHTPRIFSRKEAEVIEKALQAEMITPDDVPQKENDIPNLILKLGLLVTETYACRDEFGALRIRTIVSEDKEGLKRIKNRMTHLRPHKDLSTIDEVSTSLENWWRYAEQGSELASLEALNKTISSRKTPFKKEQLDIFFRHTKAPWDSATPKQRRVLAQMICENKLKKMTQTEWDSLSKKEASSLISSASNKGLR